ncbi:phosphonate monoester hydrolase [Pacificitalea manganoxidans]|uniref:Phosphonate monoester hydrolase n=1 Tax=Pacificitalea manganoxidans TaxID=1411902 RepID=A0A291LYP1_9RHOB|nr:alkaline phosphatase family protein [Pacificitalea manganoxidans]ATI41790.1 phosphonate monoester hydrolase [Pacificitalea manganoxidans]MDR6309256.1 arylsulfatase A-like enzyme [Pacificitalea manganoxidans]
MTKNVLFIMCDQLRWDYLSCTGHPHLHTPNIDTLAARGVLFDRAYVQSPICGPSRMSFYTGRYVASHGSTWNNIPLKVGEMTLGDHLRPLGVRTALCGKTHMSADVEGMKRLGLAPDSEIGVRVAECGFEPYEREDGLHPDGPRYPRNEAYDQFMEKRGWPDENPWQTVANSAEDEDGNILSGWFMDNADKPARAADEESETPYITSRAMDFIREAGDTPWCLHLSYIKPHWPYIVPAPYHDMYGPETHLDPVRSAAEREKPHPVYGAFMEERVSRAFCDDGTRTRVLTAYMGLIKQIDDQMGRLMAFLDAQGLTEETMIIFTSDHGDYLGDHWMGEKELFHDASARIPMIVVDPRAEADAARGQTSSALVEAIDVVPTILDYFGGEAVPHIIEGHSLVPLLHGQTDSLRDVAVSEYDYSMRGVRQRLGVAVKDAKLTMLFDGRWKYIFAEGFRPMLFDLQNDPDELTDLGADPAHQAECARMEKLLFAWARRTSQRTTRSDAWIAARDPSLGEAKAGILIGYRNEAELREVLGPVAVRAGKTHKAG